MAIRRERHPSEFFQGFLIAQVARVTFTDRSFAADFDNVCPQVCQNGDNRFADMVGDKGVKTVSGGSGNGGGSHGGVSAAEDREGFLFIRLVRDFAQGFQMHDRPGQMARLMRSHQLKRFVFDEQGSFGQIDGFRQVVGLNFRRADKAATRQTFAGVGKRQNTLQPPRGLSVGVCQLVAGHEFAENAERQLSVIPPFGQNRRKNA